MDKGQYLDALTADGEALAVAAGRDLEASVAACPAWNVARLVAHMGRIHRWAEAMVRTGARERIERGRMPQAPVGPALLPWYREGVTALVGTLRAAGPTTPVWSWAEPNTAEFWVRRQAQETSVHRWDAERATGDPTAIAAGLAADGIDELLDIFVRSKRPSDRGPSGRIRLRASDLDRGWELATDGGQVNASGTASDLLLVLWNRIEPNRLDVAGDSALLTRWQEDVRI